MRSQVSLRMYVVVETGLGITIHFTVGIPFTFLHTAHACTAKFAISVLCTWHMFCLLCAQKCVWKRWWNDGTHKGNYRYKSVRRGGGRVVQHKNYLQGDEWDFILSKGCLRSLKMRFSSTFVAVGIICIWGVSYPHENSARPSKMGKKVNTWPGSS